MIYRRLFLPVAAGTRTGSHGGETLMRLRHLVAGDVVLQQSSFRWRLPTLPYGRGVPRFSRVSVGRLIEPVSGVAVARGGRFASVRLIARRDVRWVRLREAVGGLGTAVGDRLGGRRLGGDGACHSEGAIAGLV